MSAYNDKKNGEKAEKFPPVIIEHEPVMIGYPVYCGNKSCEEYQQKQDEEWRKKHDRV